MMSCQEVTKTIASDQLVGAGWRKRLAVQLHLLMCRHCRRYATQLAAIGTAARELFREDSIPPRDLEEAILKRCLEDCGKPDASSDHPL